jgi:CheY-like chemotaxis protein
MDCIKILLAEDDYDDKNLFHEYLDNRKEIVILPIVETGKELFECLSKMKPTDFPDWIILDQNLPIKSGLEILDQLKSNATYCNIPVIIYSTYTDNHLINEGKLGGTREHAESQR